MESRTSRLGLLEGRTGALAPGTSEFKYGRTETCARTLGFRGSNSKPCQRQQLCHAPAARASAFSFASLENTRQAQDPLPPQQPLPPLLRTGWEMNCFCSWLLRQKTQRGWGGKRRKMTDATSQIGQRRQRAGYARGAQAPAHTSTGESRGHLSRPARGYRVSGTRTLRSNGRSRCL